MKEALVKEFNYTLESDAILDVYSYIGEQAINSDNFEVLTNKNLTALILASGEGKDNINDIVSQMAASQALELIDKHNFDKQSSEEILLFLQETLFNVNHSIVEYLEVANITNCSASLSIALIYKNSFFTAHIGKNRIYVIHKDEIPRLISKKTSNYLGDKSLDESNILVSQEVDLSHKETVFIASVYLNEYLSENKFIHPIEEIDEHLTNYPPLHNASFLRYLHYERSVTVLRIEKEEIDAFNYDRGMLDFNLDWQTLLPLLKKVALVLGIILIGIFLYGLKEEMPNKIDKNITQQSSEELAKESTLKSSQKVSVLEHIETNNEQITPKAISQKPIVIEQNKSLPKPTITTPKSSPKSLLELKFLKKADSDILYVEEGLRITFKENQLIASKAESFYQKGGNTQKLYCEFNTKNSQLTGEIIQKLEKQNFAKSVKIQNNGENISLSINIKQACGYTRSQWAKQSNLDLLTFSCN